MKKLYTLIMLGLFLISLIPAAIAQPETTAAGGARTGGVAVSRPINVERDTVSRNACVRKVLENKAGLSEEKTQEICANVLRLQRGTLAKAEKFKNLTSRPAFKEYNKNLEFKARALTKITLEKARTNFLRAKDNFLKARDRYQDAHQKFSEAKLKIEECKDDESEECLEIMEEIKGHAKESLTAIADRILEHLSKLEAKIESNEDLSEEEANEMLAKIAEQTAAIEKAKTTVETSETKEDIIEAAKTLKTAWARMKGKVQLNAARTINARIGGIIVKSKQLEVKLERTLERMAENDKDTSEVESLITEFNTQIETAKTSYESAQKKFKEAKATTPPDIDLIKEAQDLMKDASKALQEANKVLRDIIKSIKEADGEEELELEKDEVEIEDENEEETNDDDEEEDDEDETNDDEAEE